VQWQQVCGAYDAGQSGVGVDVDRGHQIETQQREVCQVILRQWLATQMRMHATQSAKTS